MSKVSRLVPVIAMLATAGCDSIFGSGERDLRREGILVYNENPASVTIPATVTAGVPFQVRVTTYGVGCYSAGGTSVVQVTGGVQVLPYDFLRVGGEGSCPTTLQTFEHTANVTLPTAGTATVSVQGVSVQGTRTERTRVERTVQVQ